MEGVGERLLFFYNFFHNNTVVGLNFYEINAGWQVGNVDCVIWAYAIRPYKTTGVIVNFYGLW